MERDCPNLDVLTVRRDLAPAASRIQVTRTLGFLWFVCRPDVQASWLKALALNVKRAANYQVAKLAAATAIQCPCPA